MFRLNYCRNEKYGIFREQNKNDIWKSEWVDGEAEIKLREKKTNFYRLLVLKDAV